MKTPFNSYIQPDENEIIKSERSLKCSATLVKPSDMFYSHSSTGSTRFVSSSECNMIYATGRAMK